MQIAECRLTDNPFALLRVDMDASAKAIGDAYEDALDNAPTEETKLRLAREEITNPRTRIDYEIGFLLDTPKVIIDEIVSAACAADNVRLTSLARMQHSLPRVNILAHIGSNRPLSIEQLVELIEAQGGLSPDSIVSAINECRSAASMPQVDRAVVQGALAKLIDRQDAIVVRQLLSANDGKATVTEATLALISRGQFANEALEKFLGHYARSIKPEISKGLERLNEIHQGVLQSKSRSQSIDEAVRVIDGVSDSCKPLQLLENFKGRDEAETRLIYDASRRLGLALANECGDSSAAFEFVNRVAPQFALLPRASSEISGDLKTLNDNVEFSSIEPLIDCLVKVRENLQEFGDSLLRGGLSPNAAGLAKSVYDALLVVGKSAPDKALNTVFTALRSIAIALNNEANNPRAALRLLLDVEKLPFFHA